LDDVVDSMDAWTSMSYVVYYTLSIMFLGEITLKYSIFCIYIYICLE
jgi:hypothetical protein